jgi:hypothetical protein
MSSQAGSTASPPDAAAVVTRAVVLKHLFAKACATPPLALAKQKASWSSEEANKFIDDQRCQNFGLVDQLRQTGLWNQMEAEERSFLEAHSGEVAGHMWIGTLWSIESILCLLWSLGLVADLLPYDQQAERGLVNRFPPEPISVIIQNVVLLPHKLIEKQRDVAELWHWRSRTRQLQESGYKFTLPGGMTIEGVIGTASAKAAIDGLIPVQIDNDFPAFGKAYRDLTKAEYVKATFIATERHRAFNWLCGLAPGNRWAETPTDT